MFCRKWISAAFILYQRVNTSSNLTMYNNTMTSSPSLPDNPLVDILPSDNPLIDMLPSDNPIIDVSQFDNPFISGLPSDNLVIDVSQFDNHTIETASLYTPLSSSELLKYDRLNKMKNNSSLEGISGFNVISLMLNNQVERESLLRVVGEILTGLESDKMKNFLNELSDNLDTLCMNRDEQPEFKKHVKEICKERPGYRKMKENRPDSCAIFCPKLLLEPYFGFINSYITDMIGKHGYDYENKVEIYSKGLLFYNTDDFMDIIRDANLRSKNDKRVIEFLRLFNEYMIDNYRLLANTLLQLDDLYISRKMPTWTERYRIYFMLLAQHSLLRKRLQVHFDTISDNVNNNISNISSNNKLMDGSSFDDIPSKYTVDVIAKGKVFDYEEELEDLMIELINPLGRRWLKANQKYLDIAIRNVEGLENSKARLNGMSIMIEYKGKKYVLKRVHSLLKNNTPLFTSLKEGNINVPLYTFTSGFVEKSKISSQIFWMLSREFDGILDNSEIMKTHTREIIKSLLYTLQYIHSNNVFHQNVTLKNIVFTRENDEPVFMLNNFDMAQKSDSADGIQTKMLYYKDMYMFLEAVFDLRLKTNSNDTDLNDFIRFIEEHHVNGKQYTIEDLLDHSYITQKKGILMTVSTTAKSLWQKIFG